MAAGEPLPVIPSEQSEPRDRGPGTSAATENKTPALFQKRDTIPTEPQNRAAGGRCIATGRWYAKAPATTPSPPLGSRGCSPWSGRGSQRVKPRLVSPFEKRRLFLKGQGFLRVVCARARFSLLKWQRPRVGDPSNRPAGSVGMTVRASRRDSGARPGAGQALGRRGGAAEGLAVTGRHSVLDWWEKPEKIP